jgi:hypothetical protein
MIAREEARAPWWDRKHRELGFLRGQLHRPPPGPEPRTVQEVLAHKDRLRSAWLAETHARPELRETSLDPRARASVGEIELRWGYQRFDLEASPGLPLPGAESVQTYTSCGMASLTATFLALSDEPLHVVAPEDAYFETFRALELAVRATTQRTDAPVEALRQRPGAVLLLDSCGRHDHLVHLPAARHARCVVFDTTCYEQDDPRLAEVLDACDAAGVPLVLVRSHLKLDGLGLELGRLGSTVWALGAGCSDLAAERLSRWAARHELILGAIGGKAHPASLLLERRCPELGWLRAERTRALRDNGRRWVELLEPQLSPGRVQGFHHHLFLTIESGAGDALEEIRHALVAALRRAGVPAAPLGSFGHDVVGVDTVQMPDGRRQLRLGASDLPEPLVRRGAEIVAEALR